MDENTPSLAEQVNDLAKGANKRRGSLSWLTQEQFLEYEEMLDVLVAMDCDTRPTLRNVAAIIKKKFQVCIPLRTLNEHILKRQEEQGSE